uniref:Uncharacterized protein n=1 Tax=Tanacetum cinerariifolium TaxID=118510 RepID=A0A6L2P6T1_TANCI|nr:hypothetical protein [Tanacetum cinerariifolium]
MIGSLMHLTSSRPDIMFAVCACARYHVNPKASHLHVVKKIFSARNRQWLQIPLQKLDMWLLQVDVDKCFGFNINYLIMDEAVYKELGDRLVRAATTASSLKAKQDSGAKKPWGIEFSGDKESLGEDASKQGRRIDVINVDEDITLVSVQDDADKEMFDVDVLGGEEMFVTGQNTNIVEEAVDIVFQELGKSKTTTTTPISSQQSYDKGKGIMIEEHVKPKKKYQIRLDEEPAKKLQAKFDAEERLVREKAEKEERANIALIEVWDDIQAKIDADHQVGGRKIKRAGEELVQEITKKQKMVDDKEKAELKQLMETILDEEFAMDVIPLAFNGLTEFSHGGLFKPIHSGLLTLPRSVLCQEGSDNMANENVSTPAPTRSDDHILPFAAWDILMFEAKTGAYRIYLDEDWFRLDANLLREALEITLIDQTHQFVPPPSGKTSVIGPGRICTSYPDFFVDMANLGSPTKKGKKTKPHVIPYFQFTKLIIYYLERHHNIHQRSGSPINLAEDDLSLGNLKNAPYYNAYLEMVAKREWKIAAKKEGGKKKTDPKADKPMKPAPAKQAKPATAKQSKLKPVKEKQTPTTKEALNGPSTQPQDDTSANIVRETPSPANAEIGVDADKAGSDPGKTPESRPLPDDDKIDEDQSRLDPCKKSFHPLSTPIIDLSPPKPVASPLLEPFIAVTTTETTTTTIPLPPTLQQQSTTNSELVARVTALEKKFSDFKQISQTLDNKTLNLGSRVFTLELWNLPHKINQIIHEVVKEAAHVAFQAPLRDRFRELPEADMKEIRHRWMFESGSCKSLIEHVPLYEALKASMEWENKDEFLAEKDKSQKRRHNDQDPPPLPPDSYLSKKKRHDFDTSGSKQPPAPHIKKRYGYAYLREIIICRANYNEYKISEADFKNLHPNDFEDLYLLHLQGKLNHLPGLDEVHLYNAINLWIKNIVIRQHVGDLQLGIESYQTKLNLTESRWDASGFLFKEDYTIVSKPLVIQR